MNVVLVWRRLVLAASIKATFRIGDFTVLCNYKMCHGTRPKQMVEWPSFSWSLAKSCSFSTAFQIANITMAGPGRQQQPVNIFFAVRGSSGYLLGSEVTNLLLRLTMVEFSYYMGFPVLEIAEREC